MGVSYKLARIAIPADAPVRRSDFAWPLAVIAGLTLLVLTLGIHFALGAFDDASAARERALARNGITQRIAEVGQMIMPQADWDDAVRNLDNRFDESWAEANIGKFLHQTNGFSLSFVLDAADRPIFAAANGLKQPTATYHPVARQSASLVRAVRALEAKRGAITAHHSAEMLSKPIQASALQLVNGALAITTATLVQPDFGTALPTGPRSPIVVTAMPVDARFLALFSRRFLMERLHVRGLHAPRIAGEIEIAAQDDRGRTIAWLAWQPLDPGYRLLRQILPEIGIVCTVLMVLGLLQLRRIFHFADLLIRRETDGSRALDTDRLTPAALFRDQVALEIGSLGYGVDSLAIHCVGFDGLDKIEAAIGEGAREAFMRIAAQRLAAACRGDTLVTRISPESFAMLTLGCDSHHAVGLRRRIERLMTSPVALPMGRFASRCAIGSAIVTDPAADTGEVLRAACDAMADARHTVCT